MAALLHKHPTASVSAAAGRHIANDSKRSLLQRFKAHLAA